MDGRSDHLKRGPSVPPPRTAVAAWLLAPTRSIGAEGDAELRQTLLRRLEAVIASATVTLFIAAIAALSRGTVPLLCWLALDIAVMAVRAPLILHLLHAAELGNDGRPLRPWITDLFVCGGTLWSALLGVGTMFCLCTDDPGLSVLAALLATGTIGGQGVRSPGSPRLNMVQMCLIMVPFSVGTMISALPGITWAILLTPLYLVGMISITRQLHEDYAALLVARIENRNRALHCPLTGLPNRAFFDEALAEALGRTRADRGPAIVMYLDLDGFKSVNDRLGHGAGDTLLREVAARLRAWARPGTLVSRLGGDEFAVLLRTSAPAEAEAKARAIVDSLGRSYDLGVEASPPVGVSIGLASGLPGDDVESLLRRADEALYAAKRAGKGTFRWQTPGSAPEGGSKGLSAIGRRMRDREEASRQHTDGGDRIAG